MELSVWQVPLIGYFMLIAGLAILIAPGVLRRATPTSRLFIALAAISLGLTWYYMLSYMAWSHRAAAQRAGLAIISTHDWLRDTSLFEEAWLQVCKTTRAWWWSEQLCAWTVGPLTILLAVEGKRHRVKHVWAYMLLGQVVAISVAQCLFFAAMSVAASSPASNRSVESPRTTASWTLIATVLSTLFNVALSPRLLDMPGQFLVNLLIMHALLFLPLIPPLKSKASGLSYSRLYLYVAFLCARVRWPTYVALVSFSNLKAAPLATLASLYRQAYSTLFEHPAQSSIGYDVVCASVSFNVWMIVENRRMRAQRAGGLAWSWVAGLLASMPVMGVAVTGGLLLALREWRLESASTTIEEKRTE